MDGTVTDSEPEPQTQSRLAGIILCGGQSRRMGTDKALIRFGEETLMQRACHAVAEAAEPVVAVAAPSQILPPLGSEVIVLRDLHPNAGPLGGLLTALVHLRRNTGTSDACVFLGACDSPFLNARIISRMHATLSESLDRFDCHVVIHEHRRHPLHAVVSNRVDTIASRLFESGQRSLQSLLREVRVLETPADEFRDLDPALRFLQNVNTPDQLRAARRLYRDRIETGRFDDGKQRFRK